MTAAAESQSLIPIAAFLRLQEGAADAVEARTRLLLEIAMQLASLHADGLLHRRLTLEHIRCTADVRVVDLGPSSEEISLGDGADASDLRPPELQGPSAIRLPASIAKADAVLRGAGFKTNAVQIDLYQLAALACRLLTDESLAAYLRSPRTKSKVPVALRPIIERALSVSSTDGIRTSAELADELRAVVGEPAAARNAATTAAETDASKLSIAADTSLPGSPLARRSMDSDDLPWDKLGHYQLVRRIGHGGMGDVYLGYEAALGRNVAIKVLPVDLARQSEFVRRFYAEASAAARVVHPHIIPIYYIGEDQGHHFFAMQFVEGETLAALLRRRGRLTVDETIDLLDQVLSGLEAAHAQVLIHRDIKPGNILLDRSATRALLADFGLAKSLRGDETGHTVTGVVMGTVDYMSPEQGRGHSVDHRSDLYSLGVLAYQMLSGRLPFTADSPTALIFQHVYERPKPLTSEVADVPAALSAVVAKLLAKSPDARHASAAAVRADLRAARQGAPLPSGADSALERDPEAFSRPSAAGSATVLIQAPTFADELAIDEAEPAGQLEGWRDKLGLWLGIKTPQSADWLSNTQLQVDGAVAEFERRRDRLAGLAREAQSALEELGTQEAAWRGPDVRPGDTAIRTVEELRQAREAQEAQLETMRVRLAQVNARLEQLRAQRNVLNARLRAAQAQLPAQRRFVGRQILRYWRPLVTLMLLVLTTLVVSRFPRDRFTDRTQVGTSTTADSAIVNSPVPYVPAPGQSPAAMAATALANGISRDNWTGIEKHLAISGDGTLLVSSYFDPNRERGRTCEIKLWDLEGKRELRAMSTPHRSFALRLWADAGLLISAGLPGDGGRQKELKVWDTATGEVVRVIPAEFDPIKAEVAISARATTACTLLQRTVGTLGLFDLATGAASAIEMPLSSTATSLASTADGQFTAVAVYQGLSDEGRTAIDIYDLQSRRMTTSVPTDGITRHLNFSADGRWLMAVGRAIYLWNTGDWELKHQFPHSFKGMVTTAISSDGSYVAILSAGQISVWNTANGSVRELSIGEFCLDLGFASGTTLVVSSPHSSFMLFDAATGRQQLTDIADLSGVEPLWPTQADARPLWTVPLDRQATSLAVNGNDGVVSVAAAGWIETLSAISGDILDEQATGEKLDRAILSTDGGRLAGVIEAASGGRDALIWESQTRSITRPTGAASTGVPIGFVDHDRTLLLAVPQQSDQQLVFWNLESNEPSRNLTIPTTNRESVVVHPSGNAVAVTSPSGTINLLRLPTKAGTGDPAEQSLTTQGRVLAFHPMEPWLFLGNEDDTVVAYDIDAQKVAATFHTRDGPVQQVIFDPTGRRCATVGSTAVRIWDMSLGLLRLVFEVRSVTATAFSEDGQRFAVCDATKQLHLIDTTFPSIHVDAEQWLGRLRVAGNDRAQLVPEPTRYDPKSATTPDGRLVARVQEGLLQLLDAHNGRVLHNFSGVRMVQSVAVSPDGRLAASAGYDGDTRQGDIRLWNLRSGRELRRFRGHVHYGWSIAFSSDGRKLLTGGTGVMHLWDIDSGRELQSFSTTFPLETRTAFSHDGRWAVAEDAIVGRPRTTSVFEIGGGAELATLHGGFAELVLEEFGLLRDRRLGELQYSGNVP